MEIICEGSLLAAAGCLVQPHVMVRTRQLNAPIKQVLENVSTKEGLNKWWLVPPEGFELRREEDASMSNFLDT
jgi:uncharacterized protein YndB with AHSA1/START domain